MRTAKACVLVALFVAIAVPAMAQMAGHVVINEFKAKSTEYIELFNPTGAAVDVTGWTLNSLFAGSPEVLAGVIPAGGFLSTLTPLPLSNTGDVITLADASGGVIDVVGYGARGGADLGFNSHGRSPDGWDTDDDAADFNYADGSAAETPGAPNVNLKSQLGTDLIINEVNLASDEIELYNPTGAAINPNGYIVSDGDGYCAIVSAPMVPAGGVVRLRGNLGPELPCGSFDTINFTTADVAYLYLPTGERVDQLGWFTNAPPGTLSVMRCLDGQGPNDGYDAPSSLFGFFTWHAAPSMGVSNNTICSVSTEESTWGAIKNRYQN